LKAGKKRKAESYKRQLNKNKSVDVIPFTKLKFNNNKENTST